MEELIVNYKWQKYASIIAIQSEQVSIEMIVKVPSELSKGEATCLEVQGGCHTSCRAASQTN